MARSKFIYISDEFMSNCMLEAIKAKLKNPSSVKLYFCKPRIAENGNFQWLHFMWSDGEHDYDFSDDGSVDLPWYKCFIFKGRIRQFNLGFAKRYSTYRNTVKGKKPYEISF